MALALSVSALAGQNAWAWGNGGGGVQFCLGLGWNKWNPCGNSCPAPCFPCIDPSLYGMPGSCCYINNVGYVNPHAFGYPQMGAPAPYGPVQNQYALPAWSNPAGYQSGYQPVGYYPGYYQTPAYWYGR